ncbi:glucosamine-6-phosphate deaminase [Mycoplasma sp. CSL10137]|uniref:glucosamine-6-phosphate deaminase n=1 Tax=unclassified Mycoplasma TaxID=2683645 RepID=UPI00197B5F68|nr:MULTISPECIES: glucosamine-6-phosphate deaminase [unclassified Mycoplasma]MBN4083464.1 glucosamine-6-phosphate deaminase [Mycoplasma sp. CSL10137]MBN4084605.1 glucosamine-6-phosphate deaminase [Mycoplasma sp. CSL10166]MBU4693083.1 glucosamine-6-phosphate deaminase [Mycoplasma sp. CSL7491-lung]
MKVIIKNNATEVAFEAAKIIKEQINNKPNTNLCFATGNSPIATYKNLIEYYKNGELDFSKLTSFNLDEYVGIPRESKCSYYYFMHDVLFNHINISKENINLPLGNGDIELNAKQYEELIKEKGGIDFTILGIGTNGHIAFNEPGSKITDRTREVNLTQSTIESNQKYFDKKEDVPQTAISMGIGTILESKKIILLADGEHKADAIFKMIQGPITEDVPASFLQSHNDVTVIIDKNAAKLLK